MVTASIGVVVTAVGDLERARAIAAQLVEEKLVACVTALPGVISTYVWKGAVETAEEILLVAKTTAEGADRAAERLRALHPYELPEILVHRDVHASHEYAAWVREAVS